MIFSGFSSPYRPSRIGAGPRQIVTLIFRPFFIIVRTLMTKKQSRRLPPTPFLAFCSMYYGLLAAATVAASAATERHKNRYYVAATGAATLEAVAAAEQQKDYPKAIAAAGHSAFVKIVHVRSSLIVTGLISSRYFTIRKIRQKRYHRLTK